MISHAKSIIFEDVHSKDHLFAPSSNLLTQPRKQSNEPYIIRVSCNTLKMTLLAISIYGVLHSSAGVPQPRIPPSVILPWSPSCGT